MRKEGEMELRVMDYGLGLEQGRNGECWRSWCREGAEDFARGVEREWGKWVR